MPTLDLALGLGVARGTADVGHAAAAEPVGRAIAVTAVVSFFAALLAAIVTRGLDRRLAPLGFSIRLVASNLRVAAASDL